MSNENYLKIGSSCIAERRAIEMLDESAARTPCMSFVGSALVRRLLALGALRGRLLTELVAIDLQISTTPTTPTGLRRRALPGDLTDGAHQATLFAATVDVVFHLASVPGGPAEQQPTLARRVNLNATLDLFDRCRQQVAAGGQVPRVVFASTIAVYGSPLPVLVDDATMAAPVMTYGAQKWMGEIALADASDAAGPTVCRSVSQVCWPDRPRPRASSRRF